MIKKDRWQNDRKIYNIKIEDRMIDGKRINNRKIEWEKDRMRENRKIDDRKKMI